MFLSAAAIVGSEVIIQSNYALRITPSQQSFLLQGRGFVNEELVVRFLPELTESGYTAIQQGVDFSIVVLNSTAATVFLAQGDVWRFTNGALEIYEVYDAPAHIWRNVGTVGNLGVVSPGVRVALVSDSPTFMGDDENYFPSNIDLTQDDFVIADDGAVDDDQLSYSPQTDWSGTNDFYDDQMGQVYDDVYAGVYDDENEEAESRGDDEVDNDKKKKKKKQKKQKKKDKKKNKEDDDNNGNLHTQQSTKIPTQTTHIATLAHSY